MCVHLQFKLFSFCFLSHASEPEIFHRTIAYAFWMIWFFFNCQQMSYKWWRAVECWVIYTVLMAMTLLFFINVLLGKNKLNKVSWLSFGHLFQTHSLSKFHFLWWVSNGVLLWLRKQAALVIIFIREFHDTLSCRTCNYTIPLDLNHC